MRKREGSWRSNISAISRVVAWSCRSAEKYPMAIRGPLRATAGGVGRAGARRAIQLRLAARCTVREPQSTSTE